ncbi:MAG TPA: SDR family NAD(P)-dependent oxidoreductase [Candidatus Baltobacteraceae bacterium]|jgi:short-subunit dehydrogenase|nr:SDR family NAD(P)-dependent oxidoreductase [Candidatus Baltobacteraceae bacterium]
MHTSETTRTIIVTGASSGIGRALAEQAARLGFDVLAVGRRRERLDELQHTAIGLGGRIVCLALDLRSPGAVATIISTALERFGRIDVVVNLAGGTAVGPIVEQTDEELREQFETHVLIPLALVREARSSLRSVSGQVVFVGSGLARVPVTGQGAYPCAKAAIRSAARIARSELRADGIAVTYVDPGAVNTEFMTRVGKQPGPSSILASPEHVANRILDGIIRRKNIVNAVPWQTTLVAIGDMLPAVADLVLNAYPSLVSGGPLPAAADAVPILPPDPPPQLAAAKPTAIPQDGSASTKTPVTIRPTLARRMERLGLSEQFIREFLVPGATLDVEEIALRWAGMPNKNERALIGDILNALTETGYLEREDDRSFRCLRSADDLLIS